MSNRPATPRDGASLIIYDASRNSVLMGRRAKKSRFVPDVFVFPGGGLEAHDWTVPTDRPLRQRVVNAVTQTPTSQAKAQALAMAAIRETAEETGLSISRPAKLQAELPEGWKPLLPSGHLPDASAIGYMGRAITPTESPIRFHARFFVCLRDIVDGQLRSNGELEDLQWINLDDMRKYPMIDVQEFMLERLALALKNRGKALEPYLFAYRNGRPAPKVDGAPYDLV